MLLTAVNEVSPVLVHGGKLPVSKSPLTTMQAGMPVGVGVDVAVGEAVGEAVGVGVGDGLGTCPGA